MIGNTVQCETCLENVATDEWNSHREQCGSQSPASNIHNKVDRMSYLPEKSDDNVVSDPPRKKARTSYAMTALRLDTSIDGSYVQPHDRQESPSGPFAALGMDRVNGDMASIGGYKSNWRNLDGPPVPTFLRTARLSESAIRNPSDADAEDENDENDEEFDGDGDRMGLDLTPAQISPTFSGFAELVKQMNPNMESGYLVDRIAHQQVVRYKALLGFVVRHQSAIQNKNCSSGNLCEAQGGKSVLSDSNRWHHDTGLSLDISDDDSAPEGFSGACNFPLGVPMPPTSTFPAEFECPLCFRMKKCTKPSNWIKHVYEDLQPFNCTFATCRDAKSFKRKADWTRHETERHRQLEWWTCKIDNCAHTCFRKDNFLQHLVREHKLPEPRAKFKAAFEKARGTTDEQVWRIVHDCRHETTKRPQDEPCKFCGRSFSSWKNLTVHVAKHMQRIALPVIELVKAQTVDGNTIISPIEPLPATQLPRKELPFNSLFNFKLFKVTSKDNSSITREIAPSPPNSKSMNVMFDYRAPHPSSRDLYEVLDDAAEDYRDIRSIVSVGDSAIGSLRPKTSEFWSAPLVNAPSVMSVSDSGLGSTLKSSRTTSIQGEALPQTAQQALLRILYSDPTLQILLLEGAKRISKGRFIRNVRRLLLSFCKELKTEAIDPRENDAVSMLESHAEWFASSLLDICNPNRAEDVANLKEHLNQHIDKLPILEKYLSTKLELTKSFEVAPETRSPESDGELVKDELSSSGSKSHESGSLSTFDEIPPGAIDYSAFPNLDHMKSFVTEGISFENLRINTAKFVYPERSAQIGYQDVNDDTYAPSLSDNLSNNNFQTPQPNKFHRMGWRSFPELVWALVLVRRSLRWRQSRIKSLRPSLGPTKATAGLLSSTDLHSDVNVTPTFSPDPQQDSFHTSESTSLTEAMLSGVEIDGSDDDSSSLYDDSELYSDTLEPRLSDPSNYCERLAHIERDVFDDSTLMTRESGTALDNATSLLWTEYELDTLPRLEMLLDILEITGSQDLLNLLECCNCIARICKSLTQLQICGYCSSFFSLIVMEVDRENVAKLTQVDIESVRQLNAAFESLYNSVVSSLDSLHQVIEASRNEILTTVIHSADAVTGVTRKCSLLLESMGFNLLNIHVTLEDSYPWELWQSVVQVLEFALQSYSGAHSQRFDQNFLGVSVDTFNVPKYASHTDPRLRRVTRVERIEQPFTQLRLRRLKCLDDFLGNKPVWVFHQGVGDSSVERLYVSTDINILTDIWGPSWKTVNASNHGQIHRYNIGNGSIIPLPSSSRSTDESMQGIFTRPREILCHWMHHKIWKVSELDGAQVGEPQPYFDESTTLLIGEIDHGLTVNPKCRLTRERMLHIKTKLDEDNALRSLQVYRPKRYIDSHETQMQIGGMGVTGSATISYKRRDGHTMKDVLVERWRDPGLRNPVYLYAFGGVEVSICTKNARRKRLLNILQSQTMSNYLRGLCFRWCSKKCEGAYFRALRSPRAFDKFWKKHPEWQANIGDAISKCLDVLEESGIEKDNHELNALFIEYLDISEDSESGLENDSDGTSSQSSLEMATSATSYSAYLPVEEWVVTLFRSEHTWTGFLEDSAEAMCMAVVATTCLDFEDDEGVGRRCSKPRRLWEECNWYKGFPVLQTSLYVNEAILKSGCLNPCKTGRGKRIKWNGDKLKPDSTFSLGGHGNLRVIAGSTQKCPVIVEWCSPKIELLNEIKECGINQKLLGKGESRHHREYIRGTFEADPLPILVLSRSTKPVFTKG